MLLPVRHLYSRSLVLEDPGGIHEPGPKTFPAPPHTLAHRTTASIVLMFFDIVLVPIIITIIININIMRA